MSTATTDAPATSSQQWTLRPADRCDRCGARAYAAITVASGLGLLMCAHHLNKHEAEFVRRGYVIHDERARLTEEVDG